MDPAVLAPEGGRIPLGHVLDPREPTCITADGNRQTKIDYFLVNGVARHEVQAWGAVDGTQATHRTATIVLKGDVCPEVLGLWEPKGIPEPFIGPIRQPPPGLHHSIPHRSGQPEHRRYGPEMG